VYIADVEAEVVKWGKHLQVPADPEQAVILASLNVQRFRRLEEEWRTFINDANFEHAVEISSTI
jgi:hypothetical protein